MVDIVTKQAPYYVRQNHFDESRMAGSVPAWKNNENAQDVKAITQPLSVQNTGDVDGDNANVTAPSLSFGELLDVVNPLHHLPIVGSVYREVTGDDISAVARITGGTLYGGFIGGAVSLATAAVEEHSNKDVGSAILSASSNKVTHYKHEKEERTAGFNHRKNDDIAVNDLVEKTVEVASLQKPISTPKQNMDDVLNGLSKDREPVTKVNIELAKATVLTPKKSYSFNA